jgi:hypothetical protein
MSFTPPYTFVSGNPVQASELQETQEALRKYINKDVLQSDLLGECVDYVEIARGEYYEVVRDHQFTTGDIYTHFWDTQTFNRSYFSGELKQSKDYTASPQYINIANTGKRFYLEQDAIVVLHGWIAIVVEDENLNKNIVGQDHPIYIDIDGTRKLVTYALEFSAAPASPNAGGLNLTLRRSYPISYVESLAKGWHNLSLVIDCNTQQGFASAKNVTIEAIYY